MSFAFLVLLFSLHLICMNLASGGLLVGSAAECLSRPDSRRATDLAAKLGRLAVLGILLGSLLGGGLLLFFWNDAYGDLFLRRLRSRVFFAFLEILFSLALGVCYWRWAARQAKRDAGAPVRGRYWRAFIAVAASTNLLYHFPTLFAIIAQHAPETNADSSPFARKEIYALLTSGPILSHAIHFLLASLAVSGVAGALLLRADSREGDGLWLRRLCTGVALVTTFLQIPVGIAVFLTLPDGSQRHLTGEDLLLSLAFITSLAAALWLMQLLLGQLAEDAAPSRPILSAVALAITILLMSAVLWGTRKERLTPPQQTAAQQSRIQPC